MKKRPILLQIVLALVPMIYFLLIWNSLPDRVPIHFNAQGVVNDWGSKMSVATILFFFAVLSIGVSLLLLNADKIDPKQKGKPLSKGMVMASWAATAAMAAAGIAVVYSISNYREGHSDNLNKVVFPLICLVFVVLGNYMNNVKPNFFFGIRTPWTLSDDDNWRKTHHLGSKLWFFGGLIMLALTIVLPVVSASFVLLGGVFILAIIPVAYSYRLFRNKQRSQP